jgi:hypothetical protein
VTRGACGTCAPTTVAGQPCNAGTCTDGLVCQGGVCTRPPLPGEVGEFCLDDQGCKKGLLCHALDLTCAVPPGEGEACVDPHDGTPGAGCAAPFVCQPPAAGVMGACVRGSAEGGPCAFPGPACARGLQCHLPPGAAPNDPAGGTCSSHDGQLPVAGQPCDGAQVCEIGVCASGMCPVPIPDGQACDANDQRSIRAPCNYFSECIAGACVLFDPRSCN